MTPSANPYAAPSSFGAPPSTFGAPPVGYGTPAWSNVPPKKRRSLLWAKVLGGVFVGLIGIGVLVHLYDAATKHYVTTLPASLQGLDQDDSALSQQAIAAATAQATSDGGLREVTNFQVGVYRSGSTIVVADMGNIPANSGAFRNQLLNSIVGSDASATFTSVTPGKQGGSESCGVVSDHEVCVWLDNGTMGFVFFNQPDQETTMSLLQSLRDATEH